MFTKLLESFVCDESGQGTIEYAGMLMFGAALAYFAYINRTTLTGAIQTVFGNAASDLNQIK